MPQDVREVRGIPLWLMREYLVEDGGRAENDGLVVGDGWSVQLEPMDDFRVGSLAVGQIRITMKGDSEADLARIRAILEPKLLRAGG